MTGLWLPPEVSRELRDETASANASVMEMLEISGPVQAEWNRVLRDKFPEHSIRLVRAKETAAFPGLIPGFYHLMLESPWVPVTFLPITGEGGSFAEPSHRTLTFLEGADLQNPRVIADREKEMEREIAARQKDEDNFTEELIDEAQERWAAATRTQVSMNRDTPWSQNASGARAARAYKRDPRRTEE